MNQGMPCATLSQLKNALRRQGISLNAGFSVERNAKKDLDGAALAERINQIACLVESRVSIMEKPGTIFEKLLFTGVINHLSRIFIGARTESLNSLIGVMDAEYALQYVPQATSEFRITGRPGYTGAINAERVSHGVHEMRFMDRVLLRARGIKNHVFR